MDEDVAGLVERLDYNAEHGMFDAADAGKSVSFAEAASTIRALVAENERLRKHIALDDIGNKAVQDLWAIDRDDLAKAEAKLREAVEVMRNVCEAWEWWNVDTYDRCSGVPDDAVRSARAFLADMEKPNGQ